MPSKTFMNLDKIKQKKLIDAATEEFRTVPYHNVSINKIILIAEIPRGSFYMYFKDKEDLFEYIIKINQNRLNELIKKSLIKNKGDLNRTFVELYNILIKKIHNKDYDCFLKNLLVFINLKKEQMQYPGHILFKYVEKYINKDKIKCESIDLELIFNMLLHNLFISVTDNTKNSNKNTKLQYLQKLNIICYGVYKEVK